MQPSIQIQNQAQDWTEIKRAKVRQTVQHRNAYWVNTTGKNTEPSAQSPDWIFLCEAEPYFRQMKITKSATTTGKGLEPLDMADGFWDATYAFKGIYNGVDPDDLANWNVLQEYITP